MAVEWNNLFFHFISSIPIILTHLSSFIIGTRTVLTPALFISIIFNSLSLCWNCWANGKWINSQQQLEDFGYIKQLWVMVLIPFPSFPATPPFRTQTLKWMMMNGDNAMLKEYYGTEPISVYVKTELFSSAIRSKAIFHAHLERFVSLLLVRSASFAKEIIIRKDNAEEKLIELNLRKFSFFPFLSNSIPFLFKGTSEKWREIEESKRRRRRRNFRTTIENELFFNHRMFLHILPSWIYVIFACYYSSYSFCLILISH